MLVVMVYLKFQLFGEILTLRKLRNAARILLRVLRIMKACLDKFSQIQMKQIILKDSGG